MHLVARPSHRVWHGVEQFGDHGTEFPHLEHGPALAVAPGKIKDRAGTVAPDQDRHDREHRRQDDKPGQGRGNVEQPLAELATRMPDVRILKDRAVQPQLN